MAIVLNEHSGTIGIVTMEDIMEDLDVVTVGGWVMDTLGHVPEKGNTFVYRNIQVRVLETTGKRVSKVQVSLV